MYEEDYPQKSTDIAKSRQEAKKKLAQLRSSNILMGNNHPNYSTIHNETYVQKNYNHFLKTKLPLNGAADEQKGPGFDLKATNFKFGKDPLDYNTTNKEVHGWKQPDLTGLNNTKEMVDHLRCKIPEITLIFLFYFEI